MLKVKQLHTSVYHPQTNGLVEHFSQTLKKRVGSRRQTRLGPRDPVRSVWGPGGSLGLYWIHSLRVTVLAATTRAVRCSQRSLGGPSIPTQTMIEHVQEKLVMKHR